MFCQSRGRCLTSESVQGASLPLQGVDDVHGCDGLSLGVLGVGDGITDDVLQEHLQHTTGLFVDEARDTLDTTTTSQTADGRLGDTLDVITQHLSVTLGATLSQSFSSFTTSRHVVLSNADSRMKSDGNMAALYRKRGVPSRTRGCRGLGPNSVKTEMTKAARVLHKN